jgi:hypothetical protein
MFAKRKDGISLPEFKFFVTALGAFQSLKSGGRKYFQGRTNQGESRRK